MLIDPADAPLEKITDRLYIKRDDLLDPLIGGNKFRKLKYNILHAKDQKKNTLLTFGGAYSNHILATAKAGALENMNTIGIIRGAAEHGLSPVLTKAQALGMSLQFISREDYKLRHNVDYLTALQNAHPGAYIIPEGGTNALALRGVAEIRAELPDDIDFIATACGSGGTLAGLITAYAGREDIEICGFSVLKGEDQLTSTVTALLKANGVTPRCTWHINTAHHFGGYAKAPRALVDYIKSFKEQHGLDLDYVYTGKMMHGMTSLLHKRTDIQKAVALHTGGLYTAHIRHLETA